MAERFGRPKVQPFDSFSRANMWLTAAGYCQLFKPRSQLIEACHKLYRKFSILILYIYTFSHLIYIVEIRNDPVYFMEAVYRTIPQTLLIIKATAMYIKTKRIDNMVELMKDQIFAANTKHDEELILQNQKTMYKISNILTIGIFCVGTFWALDPVLQKLKDPTSKFLGYMPFETDTWPKFLVANFLDTYGMVFWLAVGHLNIDCFIATCFAQVRLQLQIINYNLEHLFDDIERGDRENSRFKFVDDLDVSVHERFVSYVKRYERVYWFNKEITSIFNVPLTFQFIITSIASCVAIFQMSSTDNIVNFLYATAYYIAFSSQMFMYCTYGGLIENESILTSDSLYLGGWLSVSPKLRRQLLIAMIRWTRPIIPKVAGIVAISPTTFVAVTRSAYSLFTVLKTTNN